MIHRRQPELLPSKILRAQDEREVRGYKYGMSSKKEGWRRPMTWVSLHAVVFGITSNRAEFGECVVNGSGFCVFSQRSGSGSSLCSAVQRRRRHSSPHGLLNLDIHAIRSLSRAERVKQCDSGSSTRDRGERKARVVPTAPCRNPRCLPPLFLDVATRAHAPCSRARFILRIYCGGHNNYQYSRIKAFASECRAVSLMSPTLSTGSTYSTSICIHRLSHDAISEHIVPN